MLVRRAVAQAAPIPVYGRMRSDDYSVVPVQQQFVPAPVTTARVARVGLKQQHAVEVAARLRVQYPFSCFARMVCLVLFFSSFSSL